MYIESALHMWFIIQCHVQCIYMYMYVHCTYSLYIQIQKMVISGGDFKPDTLKPKEMVSLLLDDEEMKSRRKIECGARGIHVAVSGSPPHDVGLGDNKMHVYTCTCIMCMCMYNYVHVLLHTVKCQL